MMQNHTLTRNENHTTELTAGQMLENYYAGDETAFEQLATYYRPRLIGMALARLPKHLPARREMAEDLATDALVKVLNTKHKPSTRWQAGKGPVGAWMSSIIRNLMISRLRTKKGKESLGTDLESWSPEGRPQRFGAQLCDYRGEAEQEQRDAEDLRQRLLSAVSNLPEELRQLVSMKLNGRSHMEIAEKMGFSKSSVTRLMQAAQRTLQQSLAAA